jgi:signal recognition particle receptor subunit beta
MPAPQITLTNNDVTIAFIGCSSVGKTTALNAVLKNNYSYISAKKATVGINYFRVIDEEFIKRSQRHDVRTADSICCEIAKDNKTHRLLPTRKKIARRKTFNILVKEPAFSTIEDTPLLFVDVPGMDLMNPECPFKAHVDENFHTFDTIILVLDPSTTTTKATLNMLRYIRRKLRSKAIPLIIIGNERGLHIGDSNDLDDIENKIDEMFDIRSSDKVLQYDCILSTFCEPCECDGYKKEDEDDMGKGENPNSRPVFIPVRLQDAFRYRLASANLSLGSVSKLGATTIDKICQDEVGEIVWKKLSKDERLDIVHSVLSTPGDSYKIRETNFHLLMAHLERILWEAPKHQLQDLSVPVVEENKSALSSLSTRLFGKKDTGKNRKKPTIDDLRLGLGLADTLSEISSPESSRDDHDIEAFENRCKASSDYTDDTPPLEESFDTIVFLEKENPVLERRKRCSTRDKQFIRMVIASVTIVLAIIFAFVGITVATMQLK